MVSRGMFISRLFLALKIKYYTYMSEFKWDDKLAMEYARLFAFHIEYGSVYNDDSMLPGLHKFKASKQPKPEWEIVAYRFTKNSAYPGNIVWKENGNFCGWCSPESMWDNGKMNNNREVFAVKRLSDGEVFTVGDTAMFPNGWGIVKEFKIEGGDKMLVYNERAAALLKFVKSCRGYKMETTLIPVCLTPAEVKKLKQILNAYD